jgi:hypothetical protein
MHEPPRSTVSRRQFCQLVGISAALLLIPRARCEGGARPPSADRSWTDERVPYRLRGSRRRGCSTATAWAEGHCSFEHGLLDLSDFRLP